jgi:hypothetical protein
MRYLLMLALLMSAGPALADEAKPPQPDRTASPQHSGAASKPSSDMKPGKVHGPGEARSFTIDGGNGGNINGRPKRRG